MTTANDKHTAARWYRRGYTLQQIGDCYGVTGERVRQWISEVDPHAPKYARLGKKLTTFGRCPQCGCLSTRRCPTQKHCSRACATKAKHGGKWSREEHVTRVCDYCGNEFQRSRFLDTMGEWHFQYEGKQRHHYYCSQACYHAYVRDFGASYATRYTFNGQSLTLSQWAQQLDMPPYVLRYRLQAGWTLERALTEPARRKAKK